jgi:hypothetical protein
MARTHRNKKWYTAADEMTMRPSCGSCGADVGESWVFVWHYANEDCRGIKDPLELYQAIPQRKLEQQ